MEKLETLKQQGVLSVMQDQLERIITESKTLNEEDAVYYHTIKKLIDFKLNEDEVKRQFQDFQDVIIAMAKMDFSRKIYIENEKDLFSYISCGLNMLGEELEDQAMPKEVHDLVIEHLLKDKLDYVILTDGSAKIKHVSKNCETITGYSQEQLLNQDIQNFFAQNVHFINNTTESIKNKEVNMICSNSASVSIVLTVYEIPYSRSKYPYYLYMFKKEVE